MLKYSIGKEQLEKFYDELERRAQRDRINILDANGHFTDEFIHRLDGMYGTVQVIADNWTSVVYMFCEIEEERYGK